MKILKVNLNLTDETIEAFASWLGRTEGEAMDYIATRYYGRLMEDVNAFQRWAAEQATKQMVDAAIADAKQKITIEVDEVVQEN